MNRVSNVAYKLDLPPSLISIHSVFHISMLRKCDGDPSSVISFEVLGILDSIYYELVPFEILDCQVCQLQTKYVALVKAI